MNYQFIPYIIPLLASCIIMFLFALYAAGRTDVPGAKAFLVCMLIGIVWTLGNALEMAGTELRTKLFWANLQYLSYTTAPITWFLMVLEFSGNERWITKRNILLLYAIPAATVLLVWTDGFHGLVRHDFVLDLSGVFPVIAKHYGPWFWVHFGYCYVTNAVSVVLLVRAVWNKNTIYRRQSAYLLGGLSLIILFNVLYVSGLGPFPGFDISPVIFSGSGFIIAWGIFRYRLFELVPIARATVIENMASGIVVIDTSNRIIDLNPALCAMFGLKTNDVLGKSIADAIPAFGAVLADYFTVKRLSEEAQYRTELSRETGKGVRDYVAYFSCLRDYRRRPIAYAIIVNDISELQQARALIDRQQRELALLAERERLAKDLHDNLGQLLSFACVQVQSIQNELRSGDRALADAYLARLREISDDAHRGLRDYVHDMRNPEAAESPFPVLLERLAASYPDPDVAVRLNLSPELAAEFERPERKRQLYAAAREALNNVLKHASAKTVVIGTAETTAGREFYIEDDGVGFDAENGKYSGGAGLRTMRERAISIGGSFSAASVPGKGTRLSIVFAKREEAAL